LPVKWPLKGEDPKNQGLRNFPLAVSYLGEKSAGGTINYSSRVLAQNRSNLKRRAGGLSSKLFKICLDKILKDFRHSHELKSPKLQGSSIYKRYDAAALSSYQCHTVLSLATLYDIILRKPLIHITLFTYPSSQYNFTLLCDRLGLHWSGDNYGTILIIFVLLKENGFQTVVKV